MRRSIFMTVIAASLMCSGLAFGQNATVHPNSAAPSSSEAEKNAFQTPTTGKDYRQNSPGTTSGKGSGSSDSNPEARLNDHWPKEVQPNNGKSDGSAK